MQHSPYIIYSPSFTEQVSEGVPTHDWFGMVCAHIMPFQSLPTERELEREGEREREGGRGGGGRERAWKPSSVVGGRGRRSWRDGLTGEGGALWAAGGEKFFWARGKDFRESSKQRSTWAGFNNETGLSWLNQLNCTIPQLVWFSMPRIGQFGTAQQTMIYNKIDNRFI